MKPDGMSEKAWRNLHVRVKKLSIKYEKQLRQIMLSKQNKSVS
ncbi:hypothetical protein J2TS6_43520 [Paenibacillus albilobatus]|uniref:Uncharacterized protein n=1 Tax=Paenibacillus albilobatus TaxID=2716884 RepID=A0A919XJ86_9BACL|nr:hypothetical protein J2TS6_43520 [Paenibacillus albilobatus]